VSFRFYARMQAGALGLAGWVRNCPDGTVEAVAEGPQAPVEEFIAWAREGPAAAQVERVDIQWEEPRGEPPPFRVAG
jgi:acylphosphatase